MSSDEFYYLDDDDDSSEYMDYPSDSESTTSSNSWLSLDSDDDLSLEKCEEILRETKFTSELKITQLGDYYYEYSFPKLEKYMKTHMPFHYFLLDIGKIVKVNNTLNQSLEIIFSFNDKYVEKYMNTLIDDTNIEEKFHWILTEPCEIIDNYEDCIEVFVKNRDLLFKSKIKKNKDHSFFRLLFRMINKVKFSNFFPKYGELIPLLTSSNLQKRRYTKYILKNVMPRILLSHRMTRKNGNIFTRLNGDVLDVCLLKILKKYGISSNLNEITQLYSKIHEINF
jgi:hypothetical protein